jgi:hypothetical protein
VKLGIKNSVKFSGLRIKILMNAFVLKMVVMMINAVKIMIIVY